MIKEIVFEARLIPSGNLSSGHATWPPGYNFCLLTSTEHKIYHAHKCKNANYCWHFNIFSRINATCERLKARKSCLVV